MQTLISHLAYANPPPTGIVVKLNLVLYFVEVYQPSNSKPSTVGAVGSEMVSPYFAVIAGMVMLIFGFENVDQNQTGYCNQAEQTQR